MYIDSYSACLDVCAPRGTWCPLKPEEGTGSPKA